LRRDDLVHAAAGLGELREIAEINRRDLGVRRKHGQLLGVAGEGAHTRARSNEFVCDDPAKLSGGSDDEYARCAHRVSRWRRA
jgi:hypothetical protein